MTPSFPRTEVSGLAGAVQTDPARLFQGADISIWCIEEEPYGTELVLAKLDDAWAIDHASDPSA
jgi:hypothetical protein